MINLMEIAETCEKCGRAMPIRGLNLTLQQRIIYHAVKKRARSVEQLHALLYADDPNGGANLKTVHVIVFQANRRLKEYGLKIRSVQGLYYLMGD